MNALLLAAGGVTLLLINLLFFWFNPAAPATGDEIAETERWQLAAEPRRLAVDPQALVQSGVWGVQPDAGPAQAAGPGTAGEMLLDEPEAVLLRQQLRAIVRQGKQWRVLFEQGGEVLSLRLGDTLAQGAWQILDIKPDRLLLQEGERQRSLLLYPLPDQS